MKIYLGKDKMKLKKQHFRVAFFAVGEGFEPPRGS